MRRKPLGWGVKSLIIALGVIGLLFMGGVVVVVRVSPGIGAVGAEYLRLIIGDQGVAQMESVFLKINDTVRGIEYRTGLVKAAAPWQIPVTGDTSTPHIAAQPATTLRATPTTSSTAAPTPQPTSAPTATISSSPAAGQAPAAGVSQITQKMPFTQWTPQPVPAMGNLQGEGVWEPYITNASGQVVAYKTFVQPDPSRPYAVVAVVAFNLKAIQLNFVLGTQEPYASKHPPVRASGTIPSQDMTPGVLLAAFNGGFKYAQGQFGAMANGLVSAPPREGLGTIVIYPDGRIKMGAWGTDISPTGNYLAYRQNGPLAIQNGQVTPEVSNSIYWGYTINGTTVTWRSGMGISKDGSTLYYFAGPYLTIDTLSRAMLDAGAWTAMQLDINNYWVIFDTYTAQNGNLAPQALFPEQMTSNINRFQYPYTRDFFYITAK